MLEQVLENTEQLKQLSADLGVNVPESHREGERSMSTGEQATSRRPQAAEADVKEGSLLDQAIKATKQTEQSRAQELLRTLTEEALKGTITWNKDVTRTITAGHQGHRRRRSPSSSPRSCTTPEFQKLEGTWRGLNYLVMNSETSAKLKLKVLNVSKRELFKDLDRAVEFDQSQIFKKLYENEFGTPGGEPYGALIGDYEFTNHPEDIDLLSKMSNVAAAAFCPFISAASPAAVRLRELHRAVQAARPGEDLRRRSSTPSGSRSATRKTRGSSR